MRNYYCMNPIAQVGLDNFSKNYIKTDEITEAEGILVRSASMHEMELPDGLLAVARAGAGVNNIPLEKCAEKGIVVFNTPGANATLIARSNTEYTHSTIQKRPRRLAPYCLSPGSVTLRYKTPAFYFTTRTRNTPSIVFN